MHPNDMAKLYFSALTDLRWARIFELTDLGVDERSADLFAQIEIEEKKKLALEIGPQRALLSTLTHEIGEKQRWACKVRYVPPPKEFWSRQFHGFE
jgi:hypothetical protein